MGGTQVTTYNEPHEGARPQLRQLLGEVPARRDGRGFGIGGADRALAKGLVENIGGTAILRYEAEGVPAVKETAEILEHKIAVERILALLTRPGSGVIRDRAEIEAVGHRVVHGGEHFKASVLIDDDVLRAIEECFDSRPCTTRRTSRAIAPRATCCGTPRRWPSSTRRSTRRWSRWPSSTRCPTCSTSGTRSGATASTARRTASCRRRAAELLGRADDPALRLITCHLGNGCSVAAIRGGRSVDTSMGFTPLEGLVMGTRSGDLDPAILLHVMAKEELGAAEMNALLNKHSGLLGVSGLSNDMRKLLEAEAAGNERARLAVDIFCYRLRKYIGAYVGRPGRARRARLHRRHRRERGRGAGAIGGGARRDGGRRSTRRRTRRRAGGEADVAPPGAACRVLVIPTNEELLIARDTYRIVRGLPLA